MIFVRDLVGATARRLKELKAFQKVALAVNEEKQVDFVITKEQLEFYGFNHQLIFELGQIEVCVGKSAENIVSKWLISLD